MFEIVAVMMTNVAQLMMPLFLFLLALVIAAAFIVAGADVDRVDSSVPPRA